MLNITKFLLILHLARVRSLVLDVARTNAWNHASGSLVTSLSLSSEDVWLYELNTRMSDDVSRELLQADKNGRLYLQRPAQCRDLPLRAYLSSWSGEERCRGLAFLLQPVTITNSKCDTVIEDTTTIAPADYYGLSCSHNRTSWCQREYKHDVSWPQSLLSRCSVTRTGVDKSRCYLAGKLELYFTLECALDNGQLVKSDITYHLLQDDRPNTRSSHSRVRRALKTNPPFFKRPTYNVNVLEEGSKQHTVTTIQATDPQGRQLSYSLVALVDSRSQDMFNIDTNSGTITTTTKLDREFMDVHYLRVLAVTEDKPQMTATTTVQINVEDVNDHVPVFEESSYKTEVKESVSVGSTVITVRATDLDTGKNADLLYTIKSQSSKPDVFRIDPKTGVITTRLKLDREAVATHTLVVQAEDQGPPGDRLSAETVVTITVVDVNDNYPQFTEKTYYVTVAEDVDWSQRPVIGRVRAVDNDEGLNAAVHYSIIGGNTQNQFTVDEDTGDISVTKLLDHENTKNYRLVIRAQDRGSPTRSNTTQVIINVDDINDNSPKFYSQFFEEAVAENVPVGYSIVRIQAYDSDDAENARISYTLVDTTDPFPFAIDEKTGWLTTTGNIDRESTSSYQFGVEAADNGIPPRVERASIIIQVQDRNDNDPVFQNKTYDAYALETDPPGTTVISVLALDKDMDARVQYEITGGNNRNRFSITTQNAQGVISIAQPLDYQQEKRFILTVSATDSGGRFDTATIYINVTDANTHRPVFENSPYSQNVFEDAPVGTTVLVVTAADKDVGENARITYRISEEEEEGSFRIDPSTGAIVISKPLDREEREVFVLTVSATDNGVPQMSDTTDVEIVIVDVNDNAPVFTSPTYHGSVSEDAIPGTSIVEILATDRDQDLNGRIVYTFEGGDDGDGAFEIAPLSGIVRTSRPLDRETVPYYELTALAVDRGTPTLSSTIPIIIDVTDINDNPPIFSGGQLEYYIKENSPVGSVVGVIEAHDPDEGENGRISYSIIGGKDAHLFHLETETGKNSARLISDTEFDHESEETEFQLMLRAESPPLRTDIPVLVKVEDVNDNAPQLNDFRIIFNNYENNFPTEPIGRIPAYDADARDVLHYNITYGNNANLLIVNPKTGEISLSSKLNTNVGINAMMGVSVYDGKNEVRAVLSLDVLLVTKQMMHNSVTLRLNNMTQDAFLSPLFTFFVDSVSAVVPVPRENIHVFSIKSDSEVQADILNVTFSISQPGTNEEQYLDAAFVQHKIYLNLHTLIRLSTIQILPFDDNICIREPCLNFEHCQTRLMFGSAKDFTEGESILFRSIHPVKTHSCQCPVGFTGEKNHYICNIEVDMCYSNPCQNQGSCVSREGGYTCVCADNYVGVNCEISLLEDSCSLATEVCASPSSCAPLIKGGFLCENCTQSPFYNEFCQLEARSFSNGAFLSLPSLTQRFKFNLQLEFATIQKNGLLLYNGRYNGKHDFISLSIDNEGIEFMFSTGGDSVAQVRVDSESGVSDGEWHHVEVQYYNRTAVLILDHCDYKLALDHGDKLGVGWRCANKTEIAPGHECSNIFNTCHTLLDLTGPLQLGAVPGSHSAVNSPALDGCLRNLKIDHQFTDLNNFVFNNGTLSGCPERREFCMSHPCQNGGHCSEGWGGYICKCNQGWGGKDCSQKLKPAKRFNGNGFAIYDAGLYPIALPWLNSLSFRTSEENGLLMMMEIRKVGWSRLELVNGTLVYSVADTVRLAIPTPRLNDGDWHHASVKWMVGEIWLNVDYGQHELTQHTQLAIQGLTIGKVYVGGTEQKIDGTDTAVAFDGCIENVRIGDGDDDSDLSPKLEHGVDTGCDNVDTCSSATETCPSHSTCQQTWRSHKCACDSGYVGDQCYDVCHLNPCHGNSTCARDVSAPHGYRCQCGSPLVSGQYCQQETQQPCPANWWGYPVCGPCQCDVSKGFNPDCDKETGECKCKDYHYQPAGADKCLECKCFSLGSVSQLCDAVTGACQCRPGVSGQLCDTCAHKFAEVTDQGCQVVYKSCPKSYVASVWWPRTSFGQTVEVECPEGSEGKAVRHCNEEQGWSEPDLFNCTHREMLPLFQDLTQLQNDVIQMNSYLALKSSRALFDLADSLDTLYGADILLITRLLTEILQYENSQSGFNLSHKQERDFIRQIVSIASRIMEEENELALRKVQDLDRDIFVRLLSLFNEYGLTLATNLEDTYTNPFEIVTSNFMFGLDTVEPVVGNPQSRIQPDDEDTVQSANKGVFNRDIHGSKVIIPKYNHYMRDTNVWDNTKINIPRDVLRAGDNDKSIVSYSYYRTLPQFLPELYQSDLVARWGSYFRAVSSIISLTILSPTPFPETEDLSTPISLVFSVKMDQGNYPRSKPFCARWDNSDPEVAGWTQEGCETDLPDLWQWSQSSELSINCTCYRVSSYAVLLETAAAGVEIMSPVNTDTIVLYSSVASLVILAVCIIAFSLLYGLATNTNSIHRWIVSCLFIAQLLFIIAAQYHHHIIRADFACKMVAILLHYFWLSIFSWLLVDALHLQRMLTELRDINHGNMKFYVSMGFGVPAIIVGLSVGVRGHQYGNLHFCWLSLYDVSVWSMVGPLIVFLLLQILILFMAITAAFKLKSQIEDFGNLRGLLLLNIGLLPLVTGTWTCAFFLVNEDSHELTLAFSVATLVTSLYIFLGYVMFNSRVRVGLRNRYLVMTGGKLPYGESLNTSGAGHSNGTVSRSALAYRNSVKTGTAGARNIGISTASTTSRSTSKTNSTPYNRSDYYSSSDVSKIYGNKGERRHRQHGDHSDSDSDIDQRSLSLASSHTSDDDDPLEPSSGHDTGHTGHNTTGTYSVTDYNTSVPALHINTTLSGSAGLQVNDQPISAQNTLQRQHMSHDLRLPPRWSAMTTSNNDMTHDGGQQPGYGYTNTGQYRGHTTSPGSEMSSEDKYVAMSPPHLLHQTYQQYSGHSSQYTTTDMSSEQTATNLSSSIQQSSDLTPESQHIF